MNNRSSSNLSLPNLSAPADGIIRFQAPIPNIPLPDCFTDPFFYKPNDFSALAALELQEYLLKEAQWDHNFGLDTTQSGVVYGKMFGVLVVQNQAGEIGYLQAFSGKLAGKNHHPGFVPPVFDLLEETGFYRRGEAELNRLNRQIEALEQDPVFEQLRGTFLAENLVAERQISQEKIRLQTAKKARQQQRDATTDSEALQTLETTLVQQSMHDHYLLKDLKKHWKQRLEQLQSQLDTYQSTLQDLKETRKLKSAELQQRIFTQYRFLNQAGKQKSLADIFLQNTTAQPPAGAGECAAPKLLQYAFLHQLKPIAMAEFWWGASPIGEIRKHGHFYPACRGKCEPILAHMLEGIPLETHVTLGSTAADLKIETLYEDEHLLVVLKPAGLLSVPGKSVHDSVYFRLKQQYPDASGPLVVHRLDLATSGLMLIAKTSAVHKNLQSQFIKRSIQKRYVALLDGLLPHDQGTIDLPLRVDLDDRPRQMVCYEHGLSARTHWEVIDRLNGQTRVYFYPVTGRTHQLRVHAAHPNGLNTPIVGDELYGIPGDRLMLHADRVVFLHPVTGEEMVVESKAQF